MASLVKVVHLTSAHPRNDIRIFFKECRSLASVGYQVALVVADGGGDEVCDGVAIYDVGASSGRIKRIILTTKRVYEYAVKLDADIYHLHDPELITAGLKLKSLGKKVVFDFHEDVPKQILGKPYLNKYTRWIVSKIISFYESYSCKRFDAIIGATPFIRDKFLSINIESVDINNFPVLNELASTSSVMDAKYNQVCYVGGIADIRGIRQVVQAMGLVVAGTRLQLVGLFSDQAIDLEVKRCAGWQFVDELGFVDRGGVRTVLARSVAGLVTFLPLPNHIDAQPNKMFEYMSAGIPVIASNFPLWREIIEGNECGVCVNPLDPKQIAEAIDFLVANPQRARQMGENGQRVVRERYNWAVEERKLFDLYAKLSF